MGVNNDNQRFFNAVWDSKNQATLSSNQPLKDVDFKKIFGKSKQEAAKLINQFLFTHSADKSSPKPEIAQKYGAAQQLAKLLVTTRDPNPTVTKKISRFVGNLIGKDHIARLEKNAFAQLSTSASQISAQTVEQATAVMPKLELTEPKEQ